MGSHLWPFQKWCVDDPTPTDQAEAEALVSSWVLDAKLTEIWEVKDNLYKLAAELNRGVAGDTAYERAVVDEFILNCYGEFLSETELIEDQLACLMGALRRGRKLLPRDGLLGGAYDPAGCTNCGRSYAELVAGGHKDFSGCHNFIKTTVEPRGSWRIPLWQRK
jgi:hypothetical protein